MSFSQACNLWRQRLILPCLTMLGEQAEQFWRSQPLPAGSLPLKDECPVTPRAAQPTHTHVFPRSLAFISPQAQARLLHSAPGGGPLPRPHPALLLRHQQGRVPAGECSFGAGAMWPRHCFCVFQACLPATELATHTHCTLPGTRAELDAERAPAARMRPRMGARCPGACGCLCMSWS